MALKPELIYGLRVRSGMDAFRPLKEHWQAKDDDAAYRFARAVEAEVRKDYEALIWQLVEALESARVWKCKEIHHMMRESQYTPAILAGRARLEQP